MATDKVKENSKKTTERLEKQAEADYKRQLLAKLEDVRTTQLATMQALAKFLAGHTTKTEVVNQLKSIATPDALKVVEAVKSLQKDMNGKKVDWSPVLPWLEKISQHLEAIPKEHPEAPEQQQVDMTRTNELLQSFGVALANMKLVAEAPVVNVKVPKTELKVEKVDLAELKKPLMSILEAFQNFEVPPAQFTDMSQVQELLEKSNELLEKIVKKPVGSGGGGGGMVSFKDSSGFSVQVTINDDGSIPIASKATDRYAYSAKSETATYKYFFFEDKDGNWYILRKELATEIVRYAKGTGGIDSVFDSSTTDPDGSPVFASYATTFN
jgi:hypothetical protein